MKLLTSNLFTIFFASVLWADVPSDHKLTLACAQSARGVLSVEDFDPTHIDKEIDRITKTAFDSFVKGFGELVDRADEEVLLAQLRKSLQIFEVLPDDSRLGPLSKALNDKPTRFRIMLVTPEGFFSGLLPEKNMPNSLKNEVRVILGGEKAAAMELSYIIHNGRYITLEALPFGWITSAMDSDRHIPRVTAEKVVLPEARAAWIETIKSSLFDVDTMTFKPEESKNPDFVKVTRSKMRSVLEVCEKIEDENLRHLIALFKEKLDLHEELERRTNPPINKNSMSSVFSTYRPAVLRLFPLQNPNPYLGH